MCKYGSFKLEFLDQLEKEKADKLYKKIKRKTYNIDLYINIYPAKGKLEVNYKKVFTNEVEKAVLNIKEDESVERIFISKIKPNDVAFKHLLKECRVEFYHKNLENIKFKDNKYDTDYFMDTLVLEDLKNNNRTRIDVIGFENTKTIYLA
jgi:hypothetical protein